MTILFPTSSRFERNLPTSQDRVAIVGSTGSGKSTFAFWLLSEAANFHEMPWVIIDSKNDEPIAQLLLNDKLAKMIYIADEPPVNPGIYVLRPDDQEIFQLSEWLRKCWRKTHIGLWFDELYMIPDFKAGGNGGALQTILTQGRSKNIPVYGISQRPVKINLAMFSEATYFSVFRLHKHADEEKVLDYIPDGDRIFESSERLKNHYSKWRDQKHDISFNLRPCPPSNVIVQTIEQRVFEMEKRKKL